MSPSFTSPEESSSEPLGFCHTKVCWRRRRPLVPGCLWPTPAMLWDVLVILLTSAGSCRIPASPPGVHSDCLQVYIKFTAESPCPACETSALLSPQCPFSAILGHVGGAGWLPRRPSLISMHEWWRGCCPGQKGKEEFGFLFVFLFLNTLEHWAFLPLDLENLAGCRAVPFSMVQSHFFFLFCY